MADSIEIIPLVGITWNEKRICLLDPQKTVIAILGEPHGVYENKYYYCHNELRFDFDKNGNVEFIEFMAGIDGSLQPKIYGVSAFGTNAATLYDILKNKNMGKIDDNENGYGYGFSNISVGVYRPSTPESVAEMIEEAEEDGEPMDEEEIAYENQKANHWATIGIGIKDYYSKF